jgi:hydroxymethylglutaryl-CoA reductase
LDDTLLPVMTAEVNVRLPAVPVTTVGVVRAAPTVHENVGVLAVARALSVT